MELRSKKGGVHLITCGSALWLLWQEQACTRETSVVGPLGMLGRMVGAEIRQMGPPWQTMARSLHCRALSRRYLITCPVLKQTLAAEEVGDLERGAGRSEKKLREPAAGDREGQGAAGREVPPHPKSLPRAYCWAPSSSSSPECPGGDLAARRKQDAKWSRNSLRCLLAASQRGQ